jgi:hypothetical protein
MLTPADLETARFGLRVARAEVDEIDAAALAQELIDGRVDVAILRVPARPQPGVAALYALGFSPLHADTLVTYSCDLARYEPRPLSNPSLDIRPAGRDDVAGIMDLVRVVFAEYPSHYRANPLFPLEALVAGYGEWALSHLGAKDKTCWVSCVDGRIAGLACSAFDPRSGVCRGVLHGVSPAFARQRIYTDLIRYTQSYFRERGLATLEISTQVGNLRVQRVWVREGFTFERVVDTYHLSPLFGALAASPRQLTWRAPEQGAADAGWLSDRFVEALAETELSRNGRLLSRHSSLLGDIAPGASHRAELGWTLPRPGLPGPRAVCVARDVRDRPVGWASATYAS